MKEAKISGQEAFDKGDITVQWGKNAFSVNYVWQTGYHLNKNLYLILHSYLTPMICRCRSKGIILGHFSSPHKKV